MVVRMRETAQDGVSARYGCDRETAQDGVCSWYGCEKRETAQDGVVVGMFVTERDCAGWSECLVW